MAAAQALHMQRGLECDAEAVLAAAAAALHANRQQPHGAAASSPVGLHRRVLRFVLGPLIRQQQQQTYQQQQEQQQQHEQQQQQQQHEQQQQQQQQRRPADGPFELQQQQPQQQQLLLLLQQQRLRGSADSLYGASDDGTEASEEVLGMSPFASCPDLQVYRRAIAARRAEREAAAAAAAGGGASTAVRRQAALQAQAQWQRREQQQQEQQQQRAGPLRRVLAWIARAARFAARHTSPQGEGSNDATLAERICNVLTSVPFVLVGLHSLRGGGGGDGDTSSGGASAARRHFGAAFVGTGLIAGAYHASRGRARCLLRKLDYLSISYTSSVLRAATGLRAPPLVSAAAALVAPFRPTLVTGANLALIEARYLSKALAHAPLRGAFSAHAGAAAAGVCCFALEDVLVLGLGAPPVVHSLWHALSALSLGLIGPLLAHAEGALLLEGVQAAVTGAV